MIRAMREPGRPPSGARTDRDAVRSFVSNIAARLRGPVTGSPEDALRAPFEQLLGA